VKAFSGDSDVTYGGRGFGSTGLKLKGRLFALMSSRGRFVAKLPRARVEELVRRGRGQPFDPGHGRLMREWIELGRFEKLWVNLAREAHRFARSHPRDQPKGR
jgi:hypothetical protein